MIRSARETETGRSPDRRIVIHGGGLAGLSLGIALRHRAVPVSIREAGHYPRHRVCGEFISGVSQETLTFLGISASFDDARRTSQLGWWRGDHLIHRTNLPAPALGISRHLLDDRLQSKFRNLGGELLTGSRSDPEKHPPDSPGEVWATGKPSRKGPWIGLKGHFRLPPRGDPWSSEGHLEMHLGTGGYCGLAPIEGGWTNVCALFRLDRRIRAPQSSARHRLLELYLQASGNHSLADLLRNGELRDGSFCAIAGFEFGRQPASTTRLTLGDAESLIPPFTGNGMSMAFQAAEAVLPSLLAWSHGEIDWNVARSRASAELRSRFRWRMSAAGGLHALLLQPRVQALLGPIAKMHLLPFRPLLALVR